MTTKKKIERKRPERKLSDEIAKLTGKGGKRPAIDKTFTALKTAEGDGDLGSGIYHPSEEQLSVINTFTSSRKSAEEVLCFDTMSCNDIIDRDLDKFTTDCVKDFAKLDGSLGSVGKSFMVSHDYTKLPVGRIFDVGTKSVEDNLFLTNSVYMPNTEQYKDYAENLDFGIYWAVSVGVMLEDSACTVCGSPMVGNYWTFCIENGHEKGLWYDPNSEEKDSWGWALPVEPNTKGAMLCTRDLFTPKDFYELSQCFLGAQYDAQVQRGALKGVVKAASVGKVPIVNLSREEAKSFPITHVDEQVREAYAKGYTVTTEDEGVIKWTDDDNLVWVYDPKESEVMSLGEAKSDDDEDEEVNDGKGDEGKDGGSSTLGEGSTQRSEDEDGSSDEDESEGDDDASVTDPEAVGDEDDESDDEDEDEDEDDDEEEEDEGSKSASKKQVLTAASRANLPGVVIAAINEASDNGLAALARSSANLLRQRGAKVSELTPKAALGEKYLEEKRVEALKWYVRAKQSGSEQAVKVSRFKKLLDRLGDDIDAIEEVISEQKELAQAKFPASVRRSTAERDVHEIEEPEEMPTSKEASDKVARIHG